MTLTLAVDLDLHDRLTKHLAGSDVEEVAFLAAAADEPGNLFHAFDLHLLTARDFAVQTDFHVRLTDAARAATIRWAHELEATLIEAHAHRSNWPAQFSSSDLSGLASWVPHVRWRLGGRQYAALVFGDDSFDGLVWANSDGAAEPLAGLQVGDRILVPTGLTHAYQADLWWT